MQDDKSLTELPQQLNSAQIALMSQHTPGIFIKQREGRGNKILDYVEFGYVVDQLNQIFGFLGWDVESDIVEKLTTSEFIVVKTKLTVKDAVGHSVVKTAFGGVDRKKKQSDGGYVDPGDDAKAAEADGLKKAASKLGIAMDVYYPDVVKSKQILQQEESTKSPCARCKILVDQEQVKNTKKRFNVPLCAKCEAEADRILEQKKAREEKVKTPKGDCENCGAEMTQGQINYSRKLHGKTLCSKCQKQIKKGDAK